MRLPPSDWNDIRYRGGFKRSLHHGEGSGAMGGKYSTDDWRAVRRALAAGGTVRGVAAQTGVDPGAVQRWSRMGEPPEWMWLNMDVGGAYDPRLAQRDAEARAGRPKRRKLDASARLRAFVANHLMPRWSPEQISRRLREEFPDDGEMRVSHEAIYQSLYVQGRGGLRHELGVQVALRGGGTRRRPRSRLPARGKP